MVLEKTPESPLDSNEIKPFNSKGNQPWIFTGRTDAEAPILWPPDAKSCLIGKDPNAGKNWGQEEKRTTENKMVGWHQRLNGDKFEQTLGVKGRETWRAAVHGVAKSWTRLSNWTTTTTKEESETEEKATRSRDWMVWPLAKGCQQPLEGEKEKNKFFSWASRNDRILLTPWFRPHETHFALLISRPVSDTSVLF